MQNDTLKKVINTIDRISNTTIDFNKTRDGKIDLEIHIPEDKNQRKTMCRIVEDRK